MAEQNTLREALNKVTIEGVLLEVRHQEWKNGNGLNIELDIEVKENEVHTVKGMSSYTKKDGSENGVAKGYQTVINEYKSVASHGREEADKIRITQGKIGLNEYYGQDGMLRSFPELSSNFFNRLKSDDEFKPRAEFDVELFVRSVKEETNKDAEETGRAVLEGYIPLYGGKVIPFTFKVAQEGAEFVIDTFEPGSTVNVCGDIVNFKEVTEKVTEMAFGKPKKEVTTKTIREYVVTGGNEPYDEENVNTYDPELIKKALVERETYLNELKNSNKDKPQEEKKTGFGSKSNKSAESNKPKFDPNDLPF